MSSISLGDTFAGYLVERQLGAGGMGEVYLVEHPRLPRHDALKVLAAGFAGDERFRARFEHEADLVAGLSHPHIVKVHDRGEEDGRLWIAFEYVDGVDLAELARGRALAFTEIGRMIGEVADALDAAGARGLVHRDVKPENILVEHSGRALLTDFGIARAGEDSTHLTVTGTALGTVAFASPEQLRGLPVDPRADQYSLACTAFALLTGTPPYAGGSSTAMILAHIQAPIPSASARNHGLPPGVDAVLVRALAKDRAHRYPDSRSFAADLQRALSEAPAAPAPTPDGPAYAPTGLNPAGGARRRSRTPLVIGAFVAAVLVIAGVAAYALTRPDAASPSDGTGVLVAGNASFCLSGADGQVACTDSAGMLRVVSGLGSVSRMADDGRTRCAVSDGALYCWGDNLDGILGIGRSGPSGVETPQKVTSLSDVTDVALGDGQACAVSAGEVYCWGRAPGSGHSASRPEKVPGISGATAVTTATGTVCAVADGAAWCWGGNAAAQVGNGGTSAVAAPTRLNGLGRVSSIVTNGGVTCAISDDEPYCWGSPSWWHLTVPQKQPTPTKVTGMSGSQGFGRVADIALSSTTDPERIGSDTYYWIDPVLCAATDAGTAVCFGKNQEGQLGSGDTNAPMDPVTVKGLTGVTAVANGHGFTCARTGTEVRCWGEVPGLPGRQLTPTVIAWPK